MSETGSVGHTGASEGDLGARPGGEAVAALADAIRAVGSSDRGPGAGVPADAGRERAEAVRAAGEVLAAGGAPGSLAEAAVSGLGEGAAELLRCDPWSVLVLPGVRPEQADGFARGLLGPAAGPGDARRAQALVAWLLEQAAVRGHSSLEIGEVASELERFDLPDPAAALQEALANGRVMAFQEELPGQHGGPSSAGDDESPMRTVLALERLALAEESLGEALIRLTSTFVPPEADHPDAPGTPGRADADGPDPAAWEAAAGAAPSTSAAALVRAVATSALVLHTGGQAALAEPAALLHTAQGLGLRAWAACWTDYGRDSLAALLPAGSPAASRLATVTELLGGPGGPGRAEDGTLALDLLIVLDAPLLDLELAATLLESLADGTRLLLSGDPGQLWSAGPGRVFADLLAAKAGPVVPSRTPDFGPIGELVSGVGIGEFQPVETPGKEVVVLAAKNGGEAVHRAMQLLTDSIPRALGIPPEQVVLLAPGHGGSAGTRALNAAAKARLNPGPGRFGGFDPGDRAVYSPAPGIAHPARVLDGDATGLHLELSGGTRHTVSPDQAAARLRHGWALTVHQAVGRRWPGVVVVVPEDAVAGLTRQWVHTAFARAERHLSVVDAAGQALAQAVAERPAQPRTTRLRSILAEHLGQPS